MESESGQHRLQQGIAKTRDDRTYRGQQKDKKKRQHIAQLLSSGYSYSVIQEMWGCSRHLISCVAKETRSAR
ncbi:helix-turn-helix domain-containing protein [Plesiomonas shigelloides]|nr:helix-turn-helix domain-containing protein [Plesiomonas shigelloides]MCX2534416.1 helix-turn-helix domain-containing protein [Plesiomonas shigelloides]